MNVVSDGKIPSGDNSKESLEGGKNSAEIKGDESNSTPVESVHPANVNVRPGTNIGSGATPAFQPRKPALTPNKFGSPDLSAPSEMFNAYGPYVQPYVDQNASQYGRQHYPAHQLDYHHQYFAPRYIPNGLPPQQYDQTSPWNQSMDNMNPMNYAYPSPQAGQQWSRYPVAPPPSTGRFQPNNGTRADRRPHRPVAPVAPKKINVPGEASHTNSQTWVSDQHEEAQKYRVVEANLRRVEADIRSDVVPKNFSQWLEFRAGQKEDHLEDLNRRIKNKGRKIKLDPPFNDKKKLDDGKGAVLGKPTIWHHPFNPAKLGRPVADWPCLQELMEEGPHRHSSNLGRLLPHPRMPSDQPTHYKKLRYVQPFEMDRTWLVPTMETVEDRATPDAQDMMWRQQELLGEDFMKHLNIDPERD